MCTKSISGSGNPDCESSEIYGQTDASVCSEGIPEQDVTDPPRLPDGVNSRKTHHTPPDSLYLLFFLFLASSRMAPSPALYTPTSILSLYIRISASLRSLILLFPLIFLVFLTFHKYGYSFELFRAIHGTWVCTFRSLLDPLYFVISISSPRFFYFPHLLGPFMLNS